VVALPALNEVRFERTSAKGKLRPTLIARLSLTAARLIAPCEVLGLATTALKHAKNEFRSFAPDHLFTLTRERFRRRTPRPPPFSSINSTPAASIAVRILSPVPSRPPNLPSSDSSRAIVGSDTPERCAKVACDHPSRARAAFICLVVTKIPLSFIVIEFLLTAGFGYFNIFSINSYHVRSPCPGTLLQ